MAIQDFNPERRNLVVMSLAFIVYFYAGGNFPDNKVHLQVINIEFNKPVVLGVMAWALLFWFFYRYWQNHSNSFTEGFNKEIANFCPTHYLAKFASQKIGKPIAEDKEKGYHIDRLERKDGRLGLRYSYSGSVTRASKTSPAHGFSGRDEAYQGVVNFDGFLGRIVAARVYMECCFRFPSFASYVVPYVLFIFALLGALSEF